MKKYGLSNYKASEISFRGEAPYALLESNTSETCKFEITQVPLWPSQKQDRDDVLFQ